MTDDPTVPDDNETDIDNAPEPEDDVVPEATPENPDADGEDDEAEGGIDA